MKFLIEKTENEEYVIKRKWYGYYTGMVYVINNKPVYDSDIRRAETYNFIEAAKNEIHQLIEDHYPKVKPKPKSEVVMEVIY